MASSETSSRFLEARKMLVRKKYEDGSKKAQQQDYLKKKMSEAGSHVPRADAKPSKILVLRHGERKDEVDLKGWSKEASIEAKTPPFRHVNHVWGDPPLTENGLVQAQQASETVMRLLKEQVDSEVKIEKIYCSKLRRAAQTAAPLARALKVPIFFSAGLSASSAIIQKHMDEFQFLSMEKLQEVVGEDIEIKDADKTIPTAIHWYPALHYIAENEPFALIVAHRESLRYLSDSHFRTPYCCMGMFEYNPADAQFLMLDLWDMGGEKISLPTMRPFSPFVSRR